MQFNTVSFSYDSQDVFLKKSQLNTTQRVNFQVQNVGLYNFAPLPSTKDFEQENNQLFKKYEQAWRELADL